MKAAVAAPDLKQNVGVHTAGCYRARVSPTTSGDSVTLFDDQRLGLDIG
jgi:hypothetical protein